MTVFDWEIPTTSRQENSGGVNIYKLICLAPDGEYVVDKKGTWEECTKASENMGSRWFFYPFHVICTEKDTIVEAGGGLVNRENEKPYMGAMFNLHLMKV